MLPSVDSVTITFGGGKARALALDGNWVFRPAFGIMCSVIMMKNTSRKNIMSIIGMISILAFFASK